MANNIFETASLEIAKFTGRPPVDWALNATFDACVGALILSAGREVQMASLGSVALMNWNNRHGPTNVRPLNSLCAVAKLILAGYGGMFLYQGWKALPNFNATATPLGMGVAAFAARHYADPIAREIDSKLF
jgi:hypothetical protein